MEQPFKTGRIYKNRKGAYEVIRVDDKLGTMLIRYLGTGVEADTPIHIQARIWQNMGWEEQEETRRKAAEAARYQYRYGEDFTGLVSSDFKSNIEDTTWRSRRGLAGMVARLLSADAADSPYTFMSWAVYPWPVAFLADREDYAIAAYDTGVSKAKFTIELDEQTAYYGFYVERSDGPMDHTWDWPRLWKALRERPDLLNTIAEIEENHDARFLGRVYQGSETFHLSNALDKGARPLWDEQNPSALSVPERLGRLEDRPKGEWVEIFLIATMSKSEAIQEGVQLAHTMADVMKAMLPIYTAATRG